MNKMKIFVTTEVEALHNWEGAMGEREYLKYPHLHKFIITSWAKVNHADRDIEFHDLKRAVDDAVFAMLDIGGTINSFGGASCEDIGNRILACVPDIYEVTVSEDGRYGATVTRDVEPKMPIITICGSTRFKQAWLDAMKLLEQEGSASFQVGSFMHADDEEISEEQKIFFDYIHKRKIRISDGIYVLNVGGYIGNSTASEIRYAKSLGKQVRYLEPNNVPEQFK